MYSLDRNRLKVPHSAFAVLIAEHDELRSLSAVDAFDLLTAVCQRDVYLAGLEELCSGQLCRIVVLRCGSDHGAFCDFNTISCKKRLKLGARVFVMRYFALSIDKVAFKSLSPDIFPGNGYLFAAAGKDQIPAINFFCIFRFPP